jgi:hypothetical protein
MKKVLILVVLLCTVILVCGCLGVTQYTTVQKDGTISDVKLVLNTSSYVYSMLNATSGMDNQPSFQDSMAANFTKEYSGITAKDVTYNQAQDGDFVIMTWEAKGALTPLAASGVTVTENGSDVTYTYRSTTSSPASSYTSETGSMSNMSNVSNAMLNGIELDYYVTMPGKIVDTNANDTNGDTAEWHFSGASIENAGYMYATSDTTASSPGFESMIAIAGIFIGGYFIIAKRKSE